MKSLALVAVVLFGLAQQPTKTPEGKGTAQSGGSHTAQQAKTGDGNDQPTVQATPTHYKVDAPVQNKAEPTSHDNHANTATQDATGQELQVQRQLVWFT